MAKKTLLAVAALLLLGLAWRVVVLEGDVDRLSRRPESLASSAAEPIAAPTPPRPVEADRPRLAEAPRMEAGVVARVAALEAKLEAMLQQLRNVERFRDATQPILGEIAAASMSANETATIAVSRNTISAQAQFQMSAKADTDNDGTGEFGGFIEMSGQSPGRMSGALNPPVLSGRFRTLSQNGEVARNGYLFRVFLPDARGVGRGEPQAGFERGEVDANLSETTWCMYAWPVTYGQTGTRTFFTNQGGDVLATEAHVYSGSGGGPASDAAFKVAGSITGTVAIDGAASDGNVWKQVN